MTERQRPLSLLLAAAIAAVGCTELEKARFGTAEEGEGCKQVSDCKAGLDCVEKVCAPLPPLFEGPQRGDVCTDQADCDPDLFCGRQGVCTVVPPAGENEACGLTDECALPLVCSGLTGTCVADSGGAGTLGLGEDCVDLLDCQRPLICGLTGSCERLPSLSPAGCSRSDNELGAFRVYWELPPATIPDDYEFYRFPFPSDVRVVNGTISLAGHAGPGEVLGIDVPGLYFAGVEQDADGFAVNQPVFFRFSDLVDRQSLCLDAGGIYPPVPAEEPQYCAAGGPATVYLVDVTPASPTYGTRLPVQLVYSRDGGQYICQNWLGLAPLDGRPLRHATTYAAIITTGVKDIRGGAPIRDQDFAAVMAGTNPVPAMQPLLTWIAAQSIDAGTIAAATVFTTGNPDAVVPKLREAITAEPAPVFASSLICGSPGVNPCDDLLTGPEHQRGCFDPYTGFYVLQGTYQSPVYQQGTRPYLRAEDGGAFVFDAQGRLVRQGYETLCFALAVPPGPAPTEGFPTVIYGHGTGGSFHSFIDDGTARRLTEQGYAVISIDNVMHGRRQQPLSTPQNPSLWQDPGQLFFNLPNPRASRDNVLQGAADLYYLTRLLRAGQTLIGPDGLITFDGDAIAYLGHSQGTVIAPAYLAGEDHLTKAVLSGAGAELALSILNKKQPADVSQAAGVFFGDQGLARIHPMMGLLAMIFAPADAISYAHTWVLQPDNRAGPLPLLQFSGVGDSYTPDVTQGAQLRAAGLPLVGAVAAPIEGVAQVTSPQQNNLNGVTAGAVQLVPDGTYDGHFVLFDHPEAEAILEAFIVQGRIER